MQFGYKEVWDPYRPITQAPRVKYQYLGDAPRQTTTPTRQFHVPKTETNGARSGQSHKAPSTCCVCSSGRILGPDECSWCSECKRADSLAESQIASLLKSGDITTVRPNGAYGLKTDALRENVSNAYVSVPCIFKCDRKVWIAHKGRLYNVPNAKLSEDMLVNLKGIRLRPVLWRRNNQALFGVINRDAMAIIAETITESQHAAFAKVITRAMDVYGPSLVATTLDRARMSKDNTKLIAEQVRWNGNSAYLFKRRGNWNDYKQLAEDWYDTLKRVDVSTSELLERLKKNQLADFIK